MLESTEIERAIRSLQSQGKAVVPASFSAARWIAPFARQATTYLYAAEKVVPEVIQALELKEAGQGGNVAVWIPAEDDVFSQKIEAAPSIWTTGLVQTWLDLSSSGERGREAADHLRAHKLDPEWDGIR